MIVRLPQLGSAFSMDGISKDQIEADNMMPEAMPIVILFKVSEGFLKKKINNAPRDVKANGSVNDNIRVVVKFIFFRMSPVIHFMEKIFFCDKEKFWKT